MNQLSICRAFALLALVAAPQASAVTGKSFFNPRAINSEAFLNESSSLAFSHHNKPAERFSLFATGFYQESVNSKDLARYFFPNNKTELVIKGANAAGPAPDISGTWLQIAGLDANTAIELYLNAFASKISIRPEYKRFGTVLHFHKQVVGSCSRLWLALQVPVVQVETNAHLSEYDKQNEAANLNAIDRFVLINAGNRRVEAAQLTAMLNAQQAFDNPLWKYGKITNQWQKEAGVSDLDFRLGYDFSRHFTTYAKFVAPIAHKPTASHVFEPLIGNNGHWALGGGAQFVFNLDGLSERMKDSYFLTTLDCQHLFAATERRSFDLKSHGAWSRYLLVVEPEKANETLQPGINFFTQPMRVSVNAECNWNNIVHVACCSFLNFEFGYNFWVRSAEKVWLRHWNESINVAAEVFNPAGGNQFLINAAEDGRTISMHLNAAPGTDVATTSRISANDLDLSVAAHPASYSHTLHATLGTHGLWRQQPYEVAFGGAYEIPSSNRALEKWGVWLKASLSI